MKGQCTCGAVEYELLAQPMFVNCCHCTWCQRETGSAFALNAIIETTNVAVTGQTEAVALASASGKGQVVHRCPSCEVALWSHYAGSGTLTSFIRVGTLDEAGALVPGAHIFTSTKLPWVQLSPEIPTFEGYYRAKELWPVEAQSRFRALREMTS